MRNRDKKAKVLYVKHLSSDKPSIYEISVNGEKLQNLSIDRKSESGMQFILVRYTSKRDDKRYIRY